MWGISANYCFVCSYSVTNSAKLGIHNNMDMDNITSQKNNNYIINASLIIPESFCTQENQSVTYTAMESKDNSLVTHGNVIRYSLDNTGMLMFKSMLVSSRALSIFCSKLSIVPSLFYVVCFAVVFSFLWHGLVFISDLLCVGQGGGQGTIQGKGYCLQGFQLLMIPMCHVSHHIK